MTAKTYPNFVPPWQDIATLAAHICVSPATVDNWVRDGILPQPRKRGGKLMWKWAEVDEKLTLGEAGGEPETDAERIRNGTRRAAETRTGH
jgi:predicted DNA-binding transcriptional regulator AlpA